MVEQKINNIDQKTVDSFGDEWKRFDQDRMNDEEGERIFQSYFSIFPWEKIESGSTGFDMGCGTGRWAKFVLPRVNHLTCIDPSSAINIAKTKLSNFDNVSFLQESVDSTSLQPSSQDFGYSLGVLHHVPNTSDAIKSCVELLKPDAPLLLYLYYSFDNRPFWFRLIWKASDLLRKIIYRLHPLLKNFLTNVIAATVYFPLANISKFIEILGVKVDKIPLSFYKDHSFYTMRTDARDRFGTPLEQRFSKNEIEKMMEDSGLTNIIFYDDAPFWCALGYKKSEILSE